MVPEDWPKLSGQKMQKPELSVSLQHEEGLVASVGRHRPWAPKQKGLSQKIQLQGKYSPFPTRNCRDPSPAACSPPLTTAEPEDPGCTRSSCLFWSACYFPLWLIPWFKSASLCQAEALSWRSESGLRVLSPLRVFSGNWPSGNIQWLYLMRRF